MSGLVPTFKVAIAFGHLKLIFIVWPNQQDPHALQGNVKHSAFELKCSVDKTLITSYVLSREVTLLYSVLFDWILNQAMKNFNRKKETFWV